MTQIAEISTERGADGQSDGWVVSFVSSHKIDIHRSNNEPAENKQKGRYPQHDMASLVSDDALTLSYWQDGPGPHFALHVFKEADGTWSWQEVWMLSPPYRCRSLDLRYSGSDWHTGHVSSYAAIIDYHNTKGE